MSESHVGHVRQTVASRGQSPFSHLSVPASGCLGHDDTRFHSTIEGAAVDSTLCISSRC